MLQAHLGGAQDMAGRVQRDAHGTDGKSASVFHGDDVARIVQTLARDPQTRCRHEDAGAALAQVIPMGMRHHRRLHRFGRINIEIPRRAIQSTPGDGNER
jgi:hypothetical protein